ncbi:GNAT family N-acetyltransferase [Granulibacter bethesdensis]|uniref:Acetyltransferase n=1 Tax=Granulibacter bethesdensis TaxID=364410 RepID=A0AAN0RDK9_9PROT|nr:GNAT family N-acetyltransferase [Granulibacter bethesdensis]AHJ62978.1 Acetyltransferase [Granulibacter bethesdensis]AHJ66450.1 Acetyltransferase [Granulibacter bethesdensis CGDNIH4]AHJ69058.1 Acetyltransferase [Granulibacter bethesdensis]APH59502.1 Acetyltransferase [Granulibacter bethesdensis]
MIAIRRARPADAPLIGAVHVAVWRSACPGIVPDDHLSQMSVTRLAAYYDAAIMAGQGVFVLCASGEDVPLASAVESGKQASSIPRGPRVIGFSTGTRAAPGEPGEGEIGALCILDDYRERGLGRRLIRAAASHLRMLGCRSAYTWVLRDSPARWFHARLGGVAVAQGHISLAGVTLEQDAFLWEPIEMLLRPGALRKEDRDDT